MHSEAPRLVEENGSGNVNVRGGKRNEMIMMTTTRNRLPRA
jgi:hypothetical protein